MKKTKEEPKLEPFDQKVFDKLSEEGRTLLEARQRAVEALNEARARADMAGREFASKRAELRAYLNRYTGFDLSIG